MNAVLAERLGRLGDPPQLCKIRDLNRFMQLSESGLAGESDFTDEEIRGLLRALLPAAKLGIKQLATFDQVADANERAESTLRQQAAKRLGEIHKTLGVAHDLSLHARPHDLMPDDWCERQAASVADLLARVSIAVAELQQLMLPIHPPARESAPDARARGSEPDAQARLSEPVSRSSGGQNGADEIPY